MSVNPVVGNPPAQRVAIPLRVGHWVLAMVVLTICLKTNAQDAQDSYSIERGWLQLGDGIRLAATHYIPHSAEESEGFPVILELLPYRKDDISLGWSHAYSDYFARRGFAVTRVDVRGTGSSEGAVPEREYSETELDDAVEVIELLAELPWSNGNIAMWGISWGGFNSVQVAMRNPPQLKAIVAAHVSDDLYSNDVHYNDGILGIDEYMLSINHMTGFMQSPDYTVDQAYFDNRFDREPWLFSYLEQARDGDFWRPGSLRWNYEKLRIPVYFIGGLLDGYRDTLPRALENLSGPVRAVLGPWTHAWPHSAAPGPSWEWRDDAADWLAPILKPDSTNPITARPEKDFRFFVQSSAAPNTSAASIDGSWYRSSWPLPAAEREQLTLYPDSAHGLSRTLDSSRSQTDRLDYVPGAGSELGEWWGEPMPDMAAVDQTSLVYDSDALEQRLTLVGFPEVWLQAAADSPAANWLVRLEDVSPSGQVSLVAAAALNGAQRESTLEPRALVPNQFEDLNLELHFSTWTFEPGHRIRLAISNGAFPMYWPSASLGSSALRVNAAQTRVTLPLWPGISAHQPLAMVPAGASATIPDSQLSFAGVEGVAGRSELLNDPASGSTALERESGLSYRLNSQALADDSPESVQIDAIRSTSHRTDANNPAVSSYSGMAQYSVSRPNTGDEPLHYRTEIELRSDAEFFHLDIRRTLRSADEILRERSWQRSIVRDHQ